MREYQAELKLVRDFVVEVGNATYDKWQELSVVKQSDNGADVTTNYDREIEAKFKALIQSNYPEDSFVGEESGKHDGSNEFTWYIDPIDGTKYFANMVPLWGITISLLKGDQPVLGVIYNPVTNQLFHSTAGTGAFLNDVKLELKAQPATTTQVFWDYVNLNASFNNVEPGSINEQIYQKRFELTKEFYRVRELGTGQYSLTTMVCMSGVFVSPIRRKAKYMDISAGLLLAKESGAEIIRQELDENTEYIIASHPDLLQNIHEKFKFLFS